MPQDVLLCPTPESFTEAKTTQEILMIAMTENDALDHLLDKYPLKAALRIGAWIYHLLPKEVWKKTATRTNHTDLQQICNRSVLTKTDQLLTNLSSAESVFSLLQTLSLNTLRDFKTADEKQTNNRSADYLQHLQMICNTVKSKTGSIIDHSLYHDFCINLSWISHYWFVLR